MFIEVHVRLFSAAVKQMIGMFGMGVCERTERVQEGKSSHVLLLAGVYRGGHAALVRAKFALTTDGMVTMNLGVRYFLVGFFSWETCVGCNLFRLV